MFCSCPAKDHAGGGGTQHMRWVGMLVVSLTGVNFRFWSHLGCSGKNAIIFSREGLVQGCTRKKRKNIYLIMYIFNAFYLPQSYNPSFLICLCFDMVSFRGQKSLGHAQIGLLQGFNSKFPTSIPTPFICGVPPGDHALLKLLKNCPFTAPPAKNPSSKSLQLLVYYQKRHV